MRFLTLAVAALIGSKVSFAAVIYTFHGTPGSGPVAGAESFVYTARGFVGGFSAVQSSEFPDCTRCAPGTVGAFFTPDRKFGDSIQFSDTNGAGYIYRFPSGVFTKPGEYVTLPGWPNPGMLKVQVTDDLAVANAAGFDFCSALEGASCGSFGVARGSIASVFGSDNLATTTLVASGQTLPFSFAGVSVTVVDSAGVSRPASLFFVSPTQINFLVPPDAAIGAASLLVATAAGPRTISTTITTVRPGIFVANSNGFGVPAAQLIRIRADGSQAVDDVFVWDAAAQQWVPKLISVRTGDLAYLVLYGTGIRNATDVRVSCYCGGEPLNIPVTDLPVVYAGPQGQFPGLDQVNLRLPPVPGTGYFSLTWLTVGGKTSNPVRLGFQ